MALCEFSKLVGGPCSASTDYPSNVACVSIGECDRDVKGHLKLCKISGDLSLKNESRLLLARAGKQQLSYYVMLCCVSDIAFMAYGYVTMINSQSLRGALGFVVLRCC